MPASHPSLDSLLDTEARILKEDDTHAIVALRVEKASVRAFMQRNRAFFSALCDLSPALEPTRKEPA
jgi:hypothetical protein